MTDKKKVLFAAFEGLPFVKTGGLADVIYALPNAINKEKYEVRVILPLLKLVKENWKDKLYYLNSIVVNSGYIDEKANIFNYYLDGVEYLFIENDTFFNRDNVYGYGDDACRFSFFNLAIIEMMKKLNYYPDIIQSNDYHLGPLAALCKLKYQDDTRISSIKHIFTIHNLSYQGQYDKHVLYDFLAFKKKDYDNGTLRFGSGTNFLKLGIICSDYVTTVSKTYATEILTPEYGEGMEITLSYKADKLYGILNGVDYNLWNPKENDIAKNYDIRNNSRVKKYCKMALQEKIGLEVNDKVFLVGMVSRLTKQKGIDVVLNNYQKMLNKKVQLAILGSGEEYYSSAFKQLERLYEGRVKYIGDYSDDLARDFYAGLDMLLMPSIFEPCGISQLIAMRYGTIPLVRQTGGLKDTVKNYNIDSKTGNGFSFEKYNDEEFLDAFEKAYKLFTRKKGEWKQIIRNAMSYDVSFKSSAKEYETLYEQLLREM